MTLEDTKKIMILIQSLYTNFKPEAPMELVTKSWNIVLADYEYTQVERAVIAFARNNTSAYAPSTGQIVDLIHKHENPDELNETEAWDVVLHALSNSGYHADEEFYKLPSLIQKTIGKPSVLHEWAITDINTVNTIIASNFRNNYKTMLIKEHEFSKLPDNIKGLIRETADNMSYYAQIEKIRKKKNIEYANRRKVPGLITREFVGVPMPDRLKEQMTAYKENYINNKAGDV